MEHFLKVNSFFILIAVKIKKWVAGFYFWLTERQFRLSDLWVLGVYGALICWGSWKHEPWSDEAFPWIIGRDADWGTFLQILFTNQDKHPGLFYLILRPFAVMGFPYGTQTVLNVLFALTTGFVFLSRAPFSRIFRYFFLFSYFMAYEYSVIARSYMLSVMLIFFIAVFYPKRTTSPLSYAALIVLLLHSDYMCLGLGVGLTAAFTFENWKKIKCDWKFKTTFFIMVVNVLFILWLGHSLPQDHFQYGQPSPPFQIKNLAVPFANAFFPFSELTPYHTKLVVVSAVSAGVLIILLSLMALIGKPIPLIVLGFSLAELLVIFCFFQSGEYRHHGFIFISVIFTFWIAEAHQEKKPAFFREQADTFAQGSRKLKAGALVIICLLIFLNFRNLFYVYVLETFFIFSGAKPMAEAIKKIENEQKIFENGAVLVAKNKKSIALMPYLPGIKFWNPCTGDYPKFYKVDRTLASCDDLPVEEAIQKTKRHFSDLSKVIFLSEKPIPFTTDGEYYYQKVVSVEGMVFGYMYERFYLYRIYPLATLKTIYEANAKKLGSS